MFGLDLNACIFEAVVFHRLEHVKRYLADLERGRAASPVISLVSVRSLFEESLQAGYRDIAELCAWMERIIMALQQGRGQNASVLRSGISQACDRIASQAHANTHRAAESPLRSVEEALEVNAA